MIVPFNPSRKNLPRKADTIIPSVRIFFEVSVDNFYRQDRRWRQKREAILRRDKYIDQLELRAGRQVEANTVHHILPVEMFPQYRWENWNLISLSRQSHELLHNRITGELSHEGKLLMLEKAEERGIKLTETILVMGMPNSGKSTYVREHLGNGIAYDLDLIARAFRMGKDEEHKGARKMANALMKSFAQSGTRYASEVYIIRTAPSPEEIELINPDSVILCKSGRAPRQKTDKSLAELQRDVDDAEEYVKANRIPLEEVNASESTDKA